MQTAAPVEVTLAISGGSIEMNPATQTFGHLAGRSERRTPYSPWSDEWGTPRARAQWLVRGVAGTTLTLTAGCPRAGTIHHTLKLVVSR